MPVYAAYYEQLAGKKLEGFSFIVPRSCGFHKVDKNNAQPAYSQGTYSITVNVKESSKKKIVNQMIMDNSGKIGRCFGRSAKKTSTVVHYFYKLI
jgi:hypothetical protein